MSAATDPDTILALALDRHRAGRLPDAERLYRQALRLRPDHHGAYVDLVACLADRVRRAGTVTAAQPRRVPEPGATTRGRRLSVIVCSIDPVKEAAVTRTYETALAGADWELIGFNDARSLSEAYNRGIDQASGDVLIFSHDDIHILTPDFADRLCRHLDRYDGIGVAGTDRLAGARWFEAGWPHVHGQVAHGPRPDGTYTVTVYGLGSPEVPGIQAMDGLFLAVNRRVAEAVRFDDARFDGFHVYDVDFTFAAHRAGFRLAVCNDLWIVHQSGGRFGTQEWRRYADLFLDKHTGHLVARPDTWQRPTGARMETLDQVAACMASVAAAGDPAGQA